MKFGRFVIPFVLCFAAVVVQADSPELLPQYGGKPRTVEEQRADKIMVGEAIATHASRDGARDMFLQDAFARARAGDGDGAMRAANKAWLVDPESYRVRWGFAVALGTQGKYTESVRFFRKAEKDAGSDGEFFCDYGLSLFRETLLAKLAGDEQVKRFKEVERIYLQSHALHPSSDCALAGLSVLAFARGDAKAAWGYVADAERLGGKSLDPRFIKELEARMPRPQV